MTTQQLYQRFADTEQDDLDNEFIKACDKGNLLLVKYLLTSEDIPMHAHIHAEEDEGFTCAARMGHLDIVKYLATSKELKEHADIYSMDCDAFNLACDNGHIDIVEYMVFNLNIDKRDYIINHIEYKQHIEVEKMFALRKLNAQLQTDLPIHNCGSIKRKI